QALTKAGETMRVVAEGVVIRAAQSLHRHEPVYFLTEPIPGIAGGDEAADIGRDFGKPAHQGAVAFRSHVARDPLTALGAGADEVAQCAGIMRLIDLCQRGLHCMAVHLTTPAFARNSAAMLTKSRPHAGSPRCHA